MSSSAVNRCGRHTDSFTGWPGGHAMTPSRPSFRGSRPHRRRLESHRMPAPAPPLPCLVLAGLRRPRARLRTADARRSWVPEESWPRLRACGPSRRTTPIRTSSPELGAARRRDPPPSVGVGVQYVCLVTGDVPAIVLDGHDAPNQVLAWGCVRGRVGRRERRRAARRRVAGPGGRLGAGAGGGVPSTAPARVRAIPAGSSSLIVSLTFGSLADSARRQVGTSWRLRRRHTRSVKPFPRNP